VVQAVLSHLRSTRGASIFIGPGAAPLVLSADSILDGPSPPADRHAIICPGGTPIQSDSVGYRVSVTVTPPPEPSPNAIRLDFGSFRIDAESAEVPVGLECWKTQGGGGGVSTYVGGRWLTSFGSGSLFDLVKVDGSWKVARVRFTFIT
jgi:hypothetical protein